MKQSVANQKVLIEAAGRSNLGKGAHDDIDVVIGQTIRQLAEAYRQLEIFETGEFLLLHKTEQKLVPVLWRHAGGIYVANRFESKDSSIKMPKWLVGVELAGSNSLSEGAIINNGNLIVVGEVHIGTEFFYLVDKLGLSDIRDSFVLAGIGGLLLTLLTVIVSIRIIDSLVRPIITELGNEMRLSQAVIDTAPCPIVVTNNNGEVIRSNEAAGDFFTAQEQGVTGKNIVDLLPDMDISEVNVFNLVQKDSQEELVVKVEKGEDSIDGKTVDIYFIYDITSTHYAEQALLENVVRTTAIIDTVQDGIFTINEEGIIQLVNPSVEKIFGYFTGELEGQNINMLMPQPHRDQHDSYIKRYLSTGEKRIMGRPREMTARHKDGREFPIEISVNEFFAGQQRFFTGVVRDVTTRVTEQEELRNHRNRLQELVTSATAEITAIVETAVNAIVTINQDSIIQIFNPSAEAMFGWKAQEVIGKHVSILIPDMEPKEHDSLVSHYIETKEARVIGTGREIEALRKDGSLFPAFLAVGHSELANGQHMFVAFVSDITERKRNERELILAKEQAESANRAKANFLANMSHEIRTPMNAIIGFSELMIMDENLPDKAKDNVRTILRAGKNLLGIINDILDFSKIEASKIELEHICFDLWALVRNVVKMLEIKAQEKSLLLSCRFDEGVPQKVYGDPTRLRQVLVNLIGNAIKFTNKGDVTVIVEQTIEEGMLMFSVCDTGIGMTAVQVDNVFSAFSQAEESTNRRFGGTGLGTTISKQIIELMNGWIWVESEPEQGSIFRFVVQLQSAADDTPCVDEDSGSWLSNERAHRCFNILVVEDVAENARLLEIRLGMLGHQLTWVGNGQKAVDTMKQQGDWFDVILMDIQMPVLDGIAATKLIRQIPGIGDVTIVALTASVLKEEREKCYEAGVDSIIGKPIDFEALLSLMESQVPQQRGVMWSGAGAADSVQEEAAQQMPGDSHIIDLEAGLKLWVDKRVYYGALADFVRNYGHCLDHLEDLLSLEQRDVLKALVHTIKGVSGNLKLTRVEQISRELDACIDKQHERIRSLLESLQGELALVCRQVEGLSLEQEGKAVGQAGSSDLLETLNALSESLAALNPDVCAPWLEVLDGQIPDKRRLEIVKLVEAFRFEDAENVVRALIEGISPIGEDDE